MNKEKKDTKYHKSINKITPVNKQKYNNNDEKQDIPQSMEFGQVL